MEMTLARGDRVLVNKLSYDVHDVNRGDVIVFGKPPGEGGDIDDLIKRVIGLPGETVTFRDGSIFIDGVGLNEPYLEPDVLNLAKTPIPNCVNTAVADWPRFFLACRLEPQIELARRLGRWKSGWDGYVDHLADTLPELLPASPEASLVHGDLWAGNVIADEAGRPVLIDPATHFAHREVDLGMSELFGSFPRAFYETYAESWPIEPGYRERREVYNLYHLINHLNHFGAGYAGQVERILSRF